VFLSTEDGLKLLPMPHLCFKVDYDKKLYTEDDLLFQINGFEKGYDMPTLTELIESQKTKYKMRKDLEKGFK